MQAGRALTQISETAYAAGRTAVLAAQNRVHPNVPEVADALEHAAAQDFSILRQVVAASGTDTDGSNQFEFSLDVVIAGLERMLG